MYTANTMASAIEALGMSLPYSSSIPAEDPLKKDECRLAAKWVRRGALQPWHGVLGRVLVVEGWHGVHVDAPPLSINTHALAAQSSRSGLEAPRVWLSPGGSTARTC